MVPSTKKFQVLSTKRQESPIVEEIISLHIDNRVYERVIIPKFIHRVK